MDPVCSLPFITGAPQREVYFMGLIDVLTQYDTKKKAAHAAKTVKHGVSYRTGVEGMCQTIKVPTCTCMDDKLFDVYFCIIESFVCRL